jgi:hypothetical protein
LPTDRVRRDQKYLPSWKALLPEPWDSFNRFAAVLVLPRKIWAIFWGNFPRNLVRQLERRRPHPRLPV